MKKLLISFILTLCTLTLNAQAYVNYTSETYEYGIECCEFFSYTIWNMGNVNNSNIYYFLQLYHTFPCDKKTESEYGFIPQTGKMLLKLNNDNILDIKFSNIKSSTNMVQIFINDKDIKNIIDIGIKKIRIETNIGYVDLKSNIFSTLYVGYNYIKDKVNKKNIYNNF